MSQTEQINHILIGYRLGKDLTQHEFAKELGISQSLLSRLENGTKEPSFILAKKIVGFIGLDIGVVFKKYRL